MKPTAIMVSRTHPNIHFGQTLTVLDRNSTNAVVRPDDRSSKYTVDISEILFTADAANYPHINDVLEKSGGWLWN